ncbi:Concanavalin A-like lectin/glucanase [Beauveria brongniartii RCEF 3172]|uniref:Concanavalin A-like lectin/glucanase n=1 Tax=Beauveria brongniartii RCEF 3172 TaxID=1081107 RepID=A0A162JF70_9HYPO|nr:Concanavalin A-like lectin/glucanase [Beauveria brongniartii RCEF 3172]
MKTVAAVALLSAAAAVQAAFTETLNGVTYTVTHLAADGSELPVEFGPAIDATSRGAQREQRRRARAADHEKRTQTFSNWCGAANLEPPGNDGSWSRVSGAWTVPEISLRANQSDDDQPSLVQWIGIDGDGCQSGGLIQGGSGSQIDSNGQQENYAWFEFVPAPLRTFTMNVGAGDQMSGLVTADSPRSGNVTINNVSTGQSIHFYFSDGGADLCGSSAEWILEDLTSLPSRNLEPFADFPDTHFTDCQASTSDGQAAGPGTNNVNLAQNGRTLCTGQIAGTSVFVHSTSH